VRETGDMLNAMPTKPPDQTVANFWAWLARN